MTLVVGALGSRGRAQVDRRGCVTPDYVRLALDWKVRAEDRWHAAAEEATVRQARVGVAPAAETRLRVPGGDAVQRVYATGAFGGLVVVEVENASPLPFVVAFVVRARRAALDGTAVSVAGRPALLLPRPPLNPATNDPNEIVVPYPVAHRTTLRVALTLGRDSRMRLSPGGLPSADDVARGWDALLRRGLRVDLPDGALGHAVDAARASLVLDGRDVPALEDWDLDQQAAVAFGRARRWVRRRAARRARVGASWARVRSLLEAASPAVTWPDGPGPFLLAVRSLLVRDAPDGSVALLGELPPGWEGRDLEVHGAPTRAGRVSYALRWHGDRPALLWDCDAPARLRAPGLDPAWSTTDRRGEALLGPQAVRR